MVVASGLFVQMLQVGAGNLVFWSIARLPAGTASW